MRAFIHRKKKAFAILLVIALVLSVIRPAAYRVASASNESVAEAESDENDVTATSADASYENEGSSEDDSESTDEKEGALQADSEIITGSAAEDVNTAEAGIPAEADQTVKTGTAAEADKIQDEAVTLFSEVKESGCRITINAPAGSLPYPSDQLSLSVKEILPGTEEYSSYFDASLEALGSDGNKNVSFARFFDIRILLNGEEIEPSAPVEVKIDYDEAPVVDESSQLAVVHFADEGTEVIEDVDLNSDTSEIVYEQESFSVTATIVTQDGNMSDPSQKGADYALVAVVGGKNYVVQYDGSLVEAESVTMDGGDIKTVKMADASLWTYVSVDGGSYLRYCADGYDYGSDDQAHTFSYGYIDPKSAAGITTETPKVDEGGNVIVEDGVTQFDSPKDHCSIVLDGQHHIYHLDGDGYRFVAADSDASSLVGNLKPEGAELDQINSTKFYFAQVTSLPDFHEKQYLPGEEFPPEDPWGLRYGVAMARHHQVNHIDISISDNAEADIPLAYGTYYDASGNPVLTIDENSDEADKTIHVQLDDPLTVSQEHLRAATIQAFEGDPETAEPLNDAFYISGYSTNKENGISTAQVRIEGIFKVANLEPLAEDGPEPWSANPTGTPADRLAHKITYKVTAVEPNVEFPYKHPVYGQLYTKKGKPLSIKTDVTVSATFDYFSEKNECPPLQGYQSYKDGCIYNVGSSGMDFKLDGKSTVNPQPVAIEIKKTVEKDDGQPLIPEIPLDPISFVIYENGVGDMDEVADLNIGSYDHDADYSGYARVHTDNVNITSDDADQATAIIFEHDISQGMVYIAEDKNTVPRSIMDKNGKIWVFKNTVIETEYVWRGTDGVLDHVSKNYTFADDQFAAVPEFLGSYQVNGTDCHNGFLEFDVHNVYEPYKGPEKKELQPYEGTGELGAVKPGDVITYQISYKNYQGKAADIVIKDKLDANVTLEEAVGATEENGFVIWNLSQVPAGEEGTVTLKVKVKDSALKSKNGPGKVVNGGDDTTVRVGNDSAVSLEPVENPVPESPHKTEISPYQGNGVLGAVKPDDEITYQINYMNYQTAPADIVITDTLDPNVTFVDAGDGTEENGIVTWNLSQVPAGEEGTVILKVKVNKSAKTSGKVVNGGESATVKVGNDKAFTLEVVENPVPEEPHKIETSPYNGNGILGGVQTGEDITYQISYKNYKNEPADIVISDKLDPNVTFVYAGDGTLDNGIVTWRLSQVPAGAAGTVSLKVHVEESAKASKGGPGKVVNGGDNATVKVGNDNAFTLETVENPVPDGPHKREISPYVGTGVLGGVSVGDEIEYEISYLNFKSEPADIVISDKLDENVTFVEASDNGAEADGTVTWNLSQVPAGDAGTVTLKVVVKDTAKESNGGLGFVLNGGDLTTVKVGNSPAVSLETVSNPVPDEPHKKEVEPYVGTGLLGAVKPGDVISYNISYKNYKDEVADVVITDTLDPNVTLEWAPDGVENNGVVTWTFPGLGAGQGGNVTLWVKVKDTALAENGGPGKVVNGGNTASVKVGNDHEMKLELVENPVPDVPHKRETYPYQGTRVLGTVQVGSIITYEISYNNYKNEPADVIIEDKLDSHVTLLDANGGTESNGVVTWVIPDVPAGGKGKVTLSVMVNDTALLSKNGPGKVVNGGDSATVKIGNDEAYVLESVENPVPDGPTKQETSPYVGNGVLGIVKPGDIITYQINYRNYQTEPADIEISDKLDPNVSFEEAVGGTLSNGVVTWKFSQVPAGQEGTVTLKVKVNASATVENGGPGKVVNGGDTSTVKVGNDPVFTLDPVENPVPDEPHKKETVPYVGNGVLGAVKPGDFITYEISYKNYQAVPANILITDTLDTNVEFYSASGNGQNVSGNVIWNIAEVPAGEEGKVTLTVIVLEGALASKGGPGKVVNGGGSATVKVGNDPEYTLELVENPVPESPHKLETAPYQGNGELGPVKPDEEITYQISYKNYKNEPADIEIIDQLDSNVTFVEATDNGNLSNGKVNWTISQVPAGGEGTVTLKVKVLETALIEKGGPGKVVNGGNSATVKVGNDKAFTLEVVENPVPDDPFKMEISPYTGDGELGAVKPGEEIQYMIGYRNYKSTPADIVITDTLDPNVTFVEAEGGSEANGIVTWNLSQVPAGELGFVTLKVQVKAEAKASGKVVNGGNTSTVKVGNDPEFNLNTVENPVPEDPHKQEIDPYRGNGELGAVKPDDVITYQISYKNYKSTEANIEIIDQLDPNVTFVEASDNGNLTNGKVVWNLAAVPAGTAGSVTLKVMVKESAKESNGGPGNVVNGGNSATVKVGDDHEYTLERVENPVPDDPHKQETAPYQGNGELGAVKPGDVITYEINYKNYKGTEADIVISDKLDPHVEVVDTYGGVEQNGVVTWTLPQVAPGTEGTVMLQVKVLESAKTGNGGPGKVVNGGDSASVKVGNDPEYKLDVVENPVPENPYKQEISPYVGTHELGGVKPDDVITYEISYKNYKSTEANIEIIDQLDANVEFVEASDGGTLADGKVKWNLAAVAAGTEGTVTLKVRVKESAKVSNKGPGKVVNGGDSATVKVGEDPEFTLDLVENPVPEDPHKQETAPYRGNGELGAVKPGDEITYEISYRNYKSTQADIVINDRLDANVEFVSASLGGQDVNGTIRWNLADVPAGEEGKVTLTVKVLESALEEKGGPGKVVNGGETATVKVGNDNEFTLDVVENPVPEDPHKREIAPYEGNGVLGMLKPGDEVSYEISYKNYKGTAADVVISDKLDANVEFVSASSGGTLNGGKVTWTIAAVPAGESGKVTLTVKVLESALESKGGPAKIVNGGDSATVKVGGDPEFTLELVENPVPESPYKQEVQPYAGNGVLGEVQVGDEITYEIGYKNYKDAAADIVISDMLDGNVDFVSASDDGIFNEGKVSWKLTAVPAGKEGKVTVTVKVLESALKANGGPGKVVNGGETATVKVGDDPLVSLDLVENPVPDPEIPVPPHKNEVKPYKGNGKLGGVNAGDEITYEISYKNYKNKAADVVISDKLDANVKFVGASDGGKYANGTVKWTIPAVPAGKEGKVTLIVRVEGKALVSAGGPGKVVNGGETATVKIGNDEAYTLEIVENPVEEKTGSQTKTDPKKPGDSKKTGDGMPIVPLSLMVILSVLGSAVVIVEKRRRRKAGPEEK